MTLVQTLLAPFVLLRETAMGNLIPRDQIKERVDREKAIRILAKSMYRELRQNGYETREIVALTTELIGHVTEDLRPDSK